MNKIFRKVTTVLGSVALIGATIGAAAAAAYPSTFTSNTAVVYGANAASSDYSAAMNIVANLNSVTAGSSSVPLIGGEGVTENEVPLGGSIVSGKLAATLTDSKVPSLLDDRINWDDGNGADDYNVEEEILLSGVNLKTTLDDNEFKENVALTNDKGIEYRYVFDDALNMSAGVPADADTLYLTLLGKQYEVSSMGATSFTISTSDEVSLAIGESYTYKGNTFTIGDVFSDSVQVNGEMISLHSSKKISGEKVYVDTIGYHSNSPELSKVILKIGTDITKTYSDGEAYVGEDENDPMWVWTYSNPAVAAGYIGVKYNYKQTRAKDDVVYEGAGYVLPENFAEVKLDGLTDVSYSDYKVYFDDSTDLWNSTDTTSTAQVQDASVMVIEAVGGAKDAIKLTGNSTVTGGSTVGVETNKIYLRWANSTQEIEGTQANATLEVYYSDVNGDVSDSVKPRYGQSVSANNVTGLGVFSAHDIGSLIVGDTEVTIYATAVGGDLSINFTDGGAASPIVLDVGGTQLTGAAGALKWLGGDTEGTSKEVAESTDVAVQGTNVGTKDNDVMTYNGLIVKTPKSNADNDVVEISVPSDRVYGIVSVLAGGQAADGEVGALIVKDSETSSMSGKNLIVVGGSAINSVAADLLEGAYSEAAFTAQTGVSAGKFLIQSFNRNGKTALLVAGYNAADTEKASTYLLNNAVDTAVGKKYIGTSSKEATLVVQ